MWEGNRQASCSAVHEQPINSNVVGVTSDDDHKKRKELYGLNKVEIPIPSFLSLFIQQILSPIPIFQLFCTLLWVMDNYWKFTMFTLFSIFVFEFTTTIQRRKSLESLTSMSNKTTRQVSVYRSSKWSTISSEEIVPGDRFKFPKTEGVDPNVVVPCDCIIVKGAAVVNEASLTGKNLLEKSFGKKMENSKIF